MEKTRNEKIEDFTLNPEKTMFLQNEELITAIEWLKENFSNGFDITKFEQIIGADGKTPIFGEDYFTDEQLDGFETFIRERLPQVDIDYPSKESLLSYINAEIAKIEILKPKDGKPGESGKPGKPGKNGSPDTAEQVISKVKSIKGANRLGLGNIKGLTNWVKKIIDHDEEISKLWKKVGEAKILFGGGQDGGGSSILTFLGLTDSPATYVGEGGKALTVKADESGIEFVTASGTGDMTKAVYDTDNSGVVDDAESAQALTGAQAAEITANTAKVSANNSIDTHSDVTIAAAAEGDVLNYDFASSKFLNKTKAAADVAKASDLSTHTADVVNPHSVTKTQVGLGNVDNTSDATKNAAIATLTNKRINSRVTTIASSATPTPAGDSSDLFTVTALAVTATFAAPTGTLINGQRLIIRIKDNATAQTLAWNAIYRASSDLALPTTTVISKTMYLGFIYNSADSKWDLIALLDNF